MKTCPICNVINETPHDRSCCIGELEEKVDQLITKVTDADMQASIALGVVRKERDEARASISTARYCLELDLGDAAVRACLDGMGLEPGIRAEYQSDLDAAVARAEAAEDDVCAYRARNVEVCAEIKRVRQIKDDYHDQVVAVIRERDEARGLHEEALKAATAWRDGHERVIRKRDEAIAEAERLRAEYQCAHCTQEVKQARAAIVLADAVVVRARVTADPNAPNGMEQYDAHVAFDAALDAYRAATA